MNNITTLKSNHISKIYFLLLFKKGAPPPLTPASLLPITTPVLLLRFASFILALLLALFKQHTIVVLDGLLDTA